MIKLRSSERRKKGSRVAIHTKWTDQMRRPTMVEIRYDKNNHNEDEVPMIQGEPGDVSYILNGIAEIAWENGWRPRGLSGTVAAVIQNYREPAEDK